MTGYKVRLGIYELLIVNDRIRELIVQRANKTDIEKEARNTGLVKLFEDGLLKVAQGKTTYEDLSRVTAE